MKFETERLIMRKPMPSDAGDIFKNYTQDPEASKYLIWTPHKELQDTIDWINVCIESWDENENLPFIIWHKETQQAIGMVDFRIDAFKVSIGYVLSQKFWNRGLMTEATKPIIKELLKRDGIYRIEAAHDLDNPASGVVMEKLGMKYEGILRRLSLHPNISEIPRDCKLYAITK